MRTTLLLRNLLLLARDAKGRRLGRRQVEEETFREETLLTLSTTSLSSALYFLGFIHKKPCGMVLKRKITKN